jgi:hypothetical protein
MPHRAALLSSDLRRADPLVQIGEHSRRSSKLDSPRADHPGGRYEALPTDTRRAAFMPKMVHVQDEPERLDSISPVFL